MVIAFQIAGISAVALAVSYFGVTGLHHLAERHQLLDIPNKRSSHSRPTPRGGGLAIAVISLIGFIVFWLFNLRWPLTIVITFLGSAAGIATISYLDDLYSLPNRVRLTAHSLAALVSIWGLGYWDNVDIPLLGQLHLGWLGPPITFLWIVGLTNAYNFMDGIDGIAGGQAVIAGLGWAGLGWLSDQPLVGLLGLLLATTSLGFLGHNWPPARIFMGDVGSAFLGYTFAILPLMASQNDPRFALIGVLLVWPFVFDTTFTFFRRLRKGENVFAAHRSHLYQRLVITWFSHRFVTLLYMGLAFIGLLLALVWFLRIKGAAAALSLFLPLLCFGLWYFVTWQERRKTAETDWK